MVASETEEGTCPLGFPSWQEHPYRLASKHTSKWGKKKNLKMARDLFLAYISVLASALVILI